jgi:hypothetical protein
MKILAKVVYLMVAAILLSGCQSKTTGASMKIQTTGKDPKFTFAYQPEAGRTFNFYLTTNMEIGIKMTGATTREMPAAKTPPFEMSGRIAVKELDSKGNYNYEFTCDVVRVVPTSTTSNEEIGRLEQSLSAIRGMSVEMLVSPQGQILKSQLKFSGPSDPSLNQAYQNAINAANQAVLLFPKQAVGAGARWSATLPLDNPYGLKVVQTVLHEVLSWDGEHGEVRSEIHQKAKDQEVSIPENLRANFPKGFKQTMSINSNGDCLGEFDRKMPMSTHSRCTMSSKIQSSSQAEGQKMAMEMNMKIDMDMRIRE